MYIFKTEQEAITAIRSFYQDNKQTPTATFSYQINGEAVFTATIIKNRTMRPANQGLELKLERGIESDYQAMKELAGKIDSLETPVITLSIKNLRTKHGGVISNSEEEFTPLSERHLVSVSTLGSGSESERGSCSTQDLQALYMKVCSKKPPVVEKEVQEKKLKGETFSSNYKAEKGVNLNIEECSFSQSVFAEESITLKEVKVEDVLQSKSGSIFAENCIFETVIVRDSKGTISLKNTSANEVYCEGIGLKWINSERGDKITRFVNYHKDIEIEGLNIDTLESKTDTLEVKEGKVKATNCHIKTLTASGISLVLTNVQADEVILNTPKRPFCEIILNNSQIEILTFKDENVRVCSLDKTHKASLFPPSFNYPNRDRTGYLSCDASGRIEGIPHQYLAGKYVEGIAVHVKGQGEIKEIAFKECKLASFDAEESIKHPFS